MVTKLKYGNTNTYFIRGTMGGVLLDTDYAGTLPAFYKELKKNNIPINDITYVLATHYHPDHIGLLGELADIGIKVLIADVQVSSVHFSDDLYKRETQLKYKPISEDIATIISCDESRWFLSKLGIDGEVICTSSHSPDSISLVLDDGNCFVGDLEPKEYIDGYENSEALKVDWDKIRSFAPRIIHYGHAPEGMLEE